MVHFLTPEIVKKTVDIPKVAIPTVTLALCCLTVFFLANYCLLHKVIEPHVCLLINFVATFAAFTPMHDAAHGSVATTDSGVRWLNTVVGYSMGFMFPLPYSAFRCLHLKHHKYTNKPEDDVDAWACMG
jgi:beta-carotene hydroxylase